MNNLLILTIWILSFLLISSCPANRQAAIDQNLKFSIKGGANPGGITENTEMITPNELSVTVNGIESEIVNIEKVKEYTGGMNYYGYLMQIKKPEKIKTMNLDYDKISIRLISFESNETG